MIIHHVRVLRSLRRNNDWIKSCKPVHFMWGAFIDLQSQSLSRLTLITKAPQLKVKLSIFCAQRLAMYEMEGRTSEVSRRMGWCLLVRKLDLKVPMLHILQPSLVLLKMVQKYRYANVKLNSFQGCPDQTSARHWIPRHVLIYSVASLRKWRLAVEAQRLCQERCQQ
jgi:hypothetical protein